VGRLLITKMHEYLRDNSTLATRSTGASRLRTTPWTMPCATLAEGSGSALGNTSHKRAGASTRDANPILNFRDASQT
jgi:hypothetical protein